ncbi:MAG TPA: hypothetical protein VNE40_02125 [Candidatus Dormibacteraeota bacterium]|nr:hypothetical protein [Candidatus Dormibacteraeota bacterium]
MTLKKLSALLIGPALLLAALLPALNAYAAFNPNLLIDDRTFDNVNSFTSPTQIDTWLNTFSGSCISPNSGFRAPLPTGYSPSTNYTYGADATAGTIVWNAAQAYGLNPQVILTTLQKEESLVTGSSGCSELQYVAAMGNDCPDSTTYNNYSGFELYSLNGTAVTSVSGTCVDTYKSAGFSRQVITATWKFKFWEQRSEGNVGWEVNKTLVNPLDGTTETWNNSDDPPFCDYPTYMTQGNRLGAGAPNSNNPASCYSPIYYDGTGSVDGTTITLDSGATASLYTYTPHFPGNQNFDNIFTNWFGNPTTPCSAINNITSALSGSNVISYQYNSSGATNLAYVQLNNTGTACVEAHVLSSDTQSWIAHIATGMRAVDPSQGMLVASKAAVDNQESLNYILYNDANGNVEVHRFSPNLLTFPGYYDVSTDLSGVSASSGTFVAGDFLGRGYDQLAYILYNGSTGHVEVHMFDPTLKQAIGYYDVSTVLSSINPNN